MRFERRDLLWSAEHLTGCMLAGYDFVVYPRDKKAYDYDEIVVVKGEQWAEFCAKRDGMYHVPLQPFLESMRRVIDDGPIPAYVETGYVHGNIFDDSYYHRTMCFERQVFVWTVEHLRRAEKAGFDYVVYPRNKELLGFDDVFAIKGSQTAIDFAMENLDRNVVPIGPCLKTLVDLLQNENLPDIVSAGYYHNQLNNSYMNLRNLENLTEEMEKLGFDKSMIEKMEVQMKANEPAFKLFDRVDAAKGVVDITLHFKQSGQSDFYYLNRLEALNNPGRVLEAGEQYAVLAKDAEGKISSTKPLETFAEAVETFKKQDGDFALGVIKDREVVAELATMVAGKVNHIDEAIKHDYFTPPLSQTFWLDHGKGFNREQAANLVQGRSVYRDDLLSRAGNPYQAWMQLDTDKVRDNHNNLGFRQFTDAYGYDVKTQLQEYKIAEMQDPKKVEQLEQILKDGGRPLITVDRDGQPMKVFVETSVRYGKLNFFAENGKPEKREQFLKETGLEKVNGLDNKKDKSKEKETAQAQGISM